MIDEICHLDIRHFVNEECRHLANGRTAKCDCIGLILFRNLSCVSRHNHMRLCDTLVASRAIVHYVTPLSMKQNGRPVLDEGMTQFIY